MARRYGNPRHGNKRDPLDELVYIVLSTRTGEAVFRGIYRDLKKAFPSWTEVQGRRVGVFHRILAPGGLSSLKAYQLLGIFSALRREFGRATLAPLSAMPDEEAEHFLTSLPGVGKKVAKCVLMYSLDRQVLPVDVHTHRVAARLGLATKRRPDTSQDLIEAQVPAPLRYGFHVNAVAHGRAVCLPRKPMCGACVLREWCPYPKERKKK
ncbi:MAG: endonuclease III domain-containing protein [Betaproteobacteria bacterium]